MPTQIMCLCRERQHGGQPLQVAGRQVKQTRRQDRRRRDETSHTSFSISAAISCKDLEKFLFCTFPLLHTQANPQPPTFAKKFCANELDLDQRTCEVLLLKVLKFAVNSKSDLVIEGAAVQIFPNSRPSKSHFDLILVGNVGFCGEQWICFLNQFLLQPVLNWYVFCSMSPAQLETKGYGIKRRHSKCKFCHSKGEISPNEQFTNSP